MKMGSGRGYKGWWVRREWFMREREEEGDCGMEDDGNEGL